MFTERPHRHKAPFSAVGGLAVSAPDFDLSIQEERAVHSGDYAKLSTVCCGSGRKPVLSQNTRISEIRLFVAVVAEGFVGGIATVAEGNTGVF